MRFTKRVDVLQRYNAGESIVLEDARERAYAARYLKEKADAFQYSETYDVFLSHSYTDARIVKQIRKRLVETGHKVYVDWIEDPYFDRSKVNPYTALVIRHRMDRCRSLIYLTSEKKGLSSFRSS